MGNFRIALEYMVLWRWKVSRYLSGRWKQRWSIMLEKDADTNPTLSSAINRHWTMSPTKAAGFNSWCCRKEKGAFCQAYSMVKGDSAYRSLPEGEEGFGALAQTKTSPPNISFKCDPHFSAQSESELIISALQWNTWDQGIHPKFTKHQRNEPGLPLDTMKYRCCIKEIKNYAKTGWLHSTCKVTTIWRNHEIWWMA